MITIIEIPFENKQVNSKPYAIIRKKANFSISPIFFYYLHLPFGKFHYNFIVIFTTLCDFFFQNLPPKDQRRKKKIDFWKLIDWHFVFIGSSSASKMKVGLRNFSRRSLRGVPFTLLCTFTTLRANEKKNREPNSRNYIV